MEHPWFAKMNFKSLMEKKIKAPFIPKLNSKTDTQNFDVEFTSSSINEPEEKFVGQKFEGFES